MKTIYIIGCCYTLTPSQFIHKLENIGKSLNVKFHGIVVMNGKNFDLPINQNWSIIEGSNIDLDFSAYFEGLNYYKNKVSLISHPIVFMNDSLFLSHSCKANLFPMLDLVPLIEIIPIPSIIGKADKYITLCHSNPWGGQNFYISTFCFVLNESALDVFLKLPQFADADGLEYQHDMILNSWGGGLKPQFREFLRANLVYTNSPYIWHGLAHYATNKTLIISKARCIYFEHRLSGEINNIGCILPINTTFRKRFFLQVCDFLHGLINI